MEQFDFVKYFNEDVDSILAGKPQANSQQVQSEYDHILNLAAVLAETNLDPKNGKKQMLRRQLMNRCLAKNKARNNKEAIMKNLFGKHRPVLLAGSFVLVAVLSFSLIFPGALTATAKSIGNILNLGSYVTIVSDMPAPDPSTVKPLTPEQQAQLDKNGYVEIVEDDGSVITIGTRDEPTVDTVNYSSLADAQQGVSYKLLAPTYLPKGYSFKNAECYEGSKEYITLNFQGSGKNIILMQRIMNEQTKYVMGTDGQVEPVTINGNKGAWDDLNLIWNIGDVNYTLIANGCSKEEIKKIAESVK